MPTYVVYLTPDLSGPDTVPGAAGSTSGVGSGLVDLAGNQYSRSGHQVRERVYSQTGIYQSFLYAPTAVGDGRVSIPIPALATEQGGPFFYCVGRMSADGKRYYVAAFCWNRVEVWRYDLANSDPSLARYTVHSFNLATGTGAGQVNTAAAYKFRARFEGSNPTTIGYDLFDSSGGLVASDSTTDGTSGFQGTGYQGVGVDNNNNPQFFGAPVFESGGFGGTVLAPPTVAGGVISLSWTPSTGGAGPAVYKLYGSQAAPVVASPANLLGTYSGTSATHTPGTAAGLPWFYAIVAGDGGSGSATSNQVAASPDAPADVLAILGDSIANYDGPAAGLVASWGALCPGREVTICLDDGSVTALTSNGTPQNQGCPGTTSADWLPTSTNRYLIAGDGVARNCAENAAHWMNLRGATHARYRPGANDAKTSNSTPPATYRANVAATCAYLLANVPTLRYIEIAEPFYIVPGSGAPGDFTAAAPGLTRQYGYQLDALDNGTTIRRGGRGLWEMFARNPSLLGDGLHPTVAGHNAADAVDAADLLAISGYVISLPAGGTYADPGPANVRAGQPYTFNGAARVGTFDPITGSYSDPGAAYVAQGRSYLFAGSTIAGTLAPGGATDPAAVAAAVWSYAIEAGVSARGALALSAALAGGQLDGAGTGTIRVYAAANPQVARITATTTPDGNRTAVALNLP